MNKHTTGTNLPTEDSDDNSEVLESPTPVPSDTIEQSRTLPEILDWYFWSLDKSKEENRQHLRGAEAEINALIRSEKLQGLKQLRGWIDRNHYQPVNESDRWVQASGEIIAHIDAEIAAIEVEQRRLGDG